MCEIRPNSSSAIMRFTVTVQNEYRTMNGTETHAPFSAARCASSATGSMPHGFSITKGMAGVDKKVKGVRHVAVPTECDDEFRRCRLDHPTIVGKWRAAEALGPLAGDPLRTVRNSDDVASKIRRMRRYAAL